MRGTRQDVASARRMMSSDRYPSHAGTIRSVDVPLFVWMFIVLKVPIVAALLLIWWAVQEPEPEPSVGEDDGGSRCRRDPAPRPGRPRPPRRGPHAAPPPPAPARVRAATGRRLSRSAKRTTP
jgi:hypothetical protein